jgi:hypothetical protein
MENKLLGTITLEDFPPLTMPMINEQLIHPMLEAINRGMPPQELAQLPTSHMLSILRTLQVVMQQYATVLKVMAHGEVYDEVKSMSFLQALKIEDENLVAAIERDYAAFLGETQSAFEKSVAEEASDINAIISDMKSSLSGESQNG